MDLSEDEKKLVLSMMKAASANARDKFAPLLDDIFTRHMCCKGAQAELVEICVDLFRESYFQGIEDVIATIKMTGLIPIVEGEENK